MLLKLVNLLNGSRGLAKALNLGGVARDLVAAQLQAPADAPASNVVQLDARRLAADTGPRRSMAAHEEPAFRDFFGRDFEAEGFASATRGASCEVRELQRKERQAAFCACAEAGISLRDNEIARLELEKVMCQGQLIAQAKLDLQIKSLEKEIAALHGQISAAQNGSQSWFTPLDCQFLAGFEAGLQLRHTIKLDDR